MKYLTYFLSISMTMAFVDVAYVHKTPTEALVMGLIAGAIFTALEGSLFIRLWRRMGWRSKPHA